MTAASVSATASTGLTGRVALVTGASRGIGFEAALALAGDGAHVLALARTVGGLEDLDDAIRARGGSCSLIPADLADPASIDALGPALRDRFGRIDVFVANAGALGELSPLADTTEQAWRQVFTVNVDANWRLLKTLDPLLRAAPAARVIVLTSRVGGELARAYWGAYAASKAALEMMAQTYALETGTTGVRVSILDPGAMRTRMRAAAMPGEDPARLPHPSEIAPLILKLASPAYDGACERFRFRDTQA